MRVRHRMSTPAITIRPEDSMMKASKLMKEKDISRLPVVDDDGRAIGIITDRDVKEASPSKATTLDVHELYYLLSEIKVKDIMTKNPITLRIDDTVEKSAVIMHDRKVGGLPVVDEEGKVVGVITESDIFRVFIEITRIRDGGIQMGFKMTRTPGGVRNLMDDILGSGAHILSIITVYPPGTDYRNIYIRIAEMDKADLNKLQSDLSAKYELTFWVRDNINPIV